MAFGCVAQPTQPSPLPALAHHWKWFKAAAGIWSYQEEPARVDLLTGRVEVEGGVFMQLVAPWHAGMPDDAGEPGGQGTMTVEQAEQEVTKELLADFGTWENYSSSPALTSPPTK